MSARLRLLVGLALATALFACAGGPADEEELGVARASVAIGRSDPDRIPDRVVLVSIAGLRPSHYGGGGAGIVRATAALMPNLAKLAAMGAYSNGMTPVLPAAPYPAHATLVTGLHPSRHGVLGDELMGPQGLHVRGIARESRIRGTPLWRVAQAAGHAVAALNWPLTRGADIELLLPDMGVPAREPEGTWFELMSGEASPWVLDRLKRLEQVLPELGWPSTLLRDELVERLSCEIAAQPVTPGLWLLAFEQSGTALARDGPGSDGVRLGLSRVDAALGRLIECFEAAGIAESTALLVVGDRALFPIHSVVYPNVALERTGLITQSPMHLGAGVAHWDAFVRSYGGAAVVYARGEEDALLARRALEEQADQTRAFRVVSARELLGLNADPEAWFGLEGVSGYGIGKAARGMMVQATERRGLGGHLPTFDGSEVGFVAWGAGIRPGVRVPKMSQVDVAPTAGALLGLRLPDADGVTVVGILGRPGARR